MRTYIRTRSAGGTYFFTVNLAERKARLLTEHIIELREAFRRTRRDHPFLLDAIVVLPDHLHCLWTMPDGDDDYPTRWRLIKSRFSRGIAHGEWVSNSRRRKGERGIWQRRYWEHLIRDDHDYRVHADYIHYNPVKHGHAASPADWPYSTFHRWLDRGTYPPGWGGSHETMTHEPE
ncbi:REP-associated tyrosine transposase [Pseudoxanthomonas putridarboris]|uniref:Transposase n=1 Tax=Pseudoxanthomonas putridarboris TaxID=752605 RepID=A0ABU9J1Z8_9GAMM